MQELQVIEQKRRETIEETRKRRDKSMRGIVTIAFVSLALNILQAVAIYILQAGPV